MAGSNEMMRFFMIWLSDEKNGQNFPEEKHDILAELLQNDSARADFL